MRWRNIGNANLVGRISSIDALKATGHVIVGSAAGGVFKSVSGGVAWQPIFDQYGAASIGDVKINQTNPDIIWVGTGEWYATPPHGAMVSISPPTAASRSRTSD